MIELFKRKKKGVGETIIATDTLIKKEIKEKAKLKEDSENKKEINETKLGSTEMKMVTNELLKD